MEKINNFERIFFKWLLSVVFSPDMPKSYRFKMVAMKFPEHSKDEPIPFDEELLSQLSKDEQRRLTNARSSFKFTHFMDILTGDENEEMMREKKLRQEVGVAWICGSGVRFCLFFLLVSFDSNTVRMREQY